MLLAIDIGNTNITLGVHDGQGWRHHWRIATAAERMPDEYGLQLRGLLDWAGVRPEDLEGVSLASVVPPVTAKMVQAVQRYVGHTPFVVRAGVRTGIRIRYEEPKAVGADRIADAVAVKQQYGGPACVVDFGTAITFDAITAEGDYLGGAITPGLEVAAEALFRRTAKLPKVEVRQPPGVVGRNTVQAIQAGLFYGYVALVEGMVARFRQVLGPEMKVIATGGYATRFAAATRVIDIVNPWLTLDGLRWLWLLNRLQSPGQGTG